MAISTQQYARAMYEFLCDAKPDELDGHIECIARLFKEHRLFKKKQIIIAAYEAIAKKQEGAVDIEITAAHPLEEKIVVQIKKIFETSGNATIKEDMTLIGGIRVRKENTIIDASIKTQLERLHRQLIHSS